MDEQFKKELIKRFDAVIKLLTISAMKENSQTEKIVLLNSAGFTPKEISEILNTTGNTVNVTLSKIKNKSKKKGGVDDKQGSNDGMANSEKSVTTENISNN